MKRDSEGVMVNVGQPDRAVTSGWPLVNVDESLRRIKQAQAFAWWSMANDPTRRWDQRHQWYRR